MTLIIRQLVIRGEVLEDSAKYRRENDLNLEKVAELVENAKKDIEREYQERMMEMLENTAAR
ncbi:DUF5908 family protein [Algoriphagus sp. NG3]|uniref:DUF5908 family protein n=1 Tax=unclassified Algoriphagus TaxID=2641541 RepID=UPI002A813488|nr:DUF5908 family protein [Algoriphagus sp. NG3]WPR77342.1 hypothetical protein SLW71_08285 [Algoriphagus sp. NG3]